MSKKPAASPGKKSGRGKKGAADTSAPAENAAAGSNGASNAGTSAGAEAVIAESNGADAPATKRLTWPARIVRALSLAMLALTIALVGVLWFISEDTWWGTVLTYSPRMLFLLPPALLAAGSFLVHRRSAIANVLSAAIIFGPLMGGRLPVSAARGAPPAGALTVVSCNVQHYHPDFESVLRKITDLRPDVVALQEAPGDHRLLQKYFEHWNVVHESEYFVASRFPIRRLAVCDGTAFHRAVVLSVQIDAPAPVGPFVLHDVHLTTARKGLTGLSPSSVWNGSGTARLEEHTRRRLAESLEASHHVSTIRPELPTLVVGDFNAPNVSRVYRSAWRSFVNAFDQVGFGFGYTSPCAEQAHWPDNWPWLRIDHILTDARWRLWSCHVGSGRGSDHRPIWAVVSGTPANAGD